jgi:hypothetical protein
MALASCSTNGIASSVGFVHKVVANVIDALTVSWTGCTLTPSLSSSSAQYPLLSSSSSVGQQGQLSGTWKGQDRDWLKSLAPGRIVGRNSSAVSPGERDALVPFNLQVATTI